MRHRKADSINSGTDWTEKAITGFPPSVIIKRVRAEAQAPATQVAMSIREESNPSRTIKKVLEYSLGDSPLDSEEDILAHADKSHFGVTGTLYVAVKVDTAAVVDIVIEYETNERAKS